MTRIFTAALTSFALAGTTLAIDLTPRYIITHTDGVPVRRPYFAAGDKKFAVTIDAETELREYEGSAIFNFLKFPRAVMRLRASPLQAEVPFDEFNLGRYRKAALGLILPGAEKAVIELEQPNAMPINDWQSHRFVITYEVAGSPMRESVMFLNLERQKQIVVQVRARDADFIMVAARSEDILRRWHEVTPGSEVAGN